MKPLCENVQPVHLNPLHIGVCTPAHDGHHGCDCCHIIDARR